MHPFLTAIPKSISARIIEFSEIPAAEASFAISLYLSSGIRSPVWILSVIVVPFQMKLLSLKMLLCALTLHVRVTI
nr:MAG TPA: hypothetical protein [Caudoviricetes sp.]